MKKEDQEKLRSYYHSLVGQQRVFEDVHAKDTIMIEGGPVRVLVAELSRLESDFPGFLPTLRADEFIRQRYGSSTYYELSGIRAHLAMAIGRLKVAIESSESTPVTETREFPFVKNAELRSILKRDYSEIQRAFVARCWKSVIILAGGAIEAILLDLLLQDQSTTKAASKAPKELDITQWRLVDLIKVSVELRRVNPGVEKLSHSVREYRNLVHPGNELHHKLTCEPEEAKIAIEVLHMIDRDLCK